MNVNDALHSLGYLLGRDLVGPTRVIVERWSVNKSESPLYLRDAELRLHLRDAATLRRVDRFFAPDLDELSYIEYVGGAHLLLVPNGDEIEVFDGG